jgi:hypothetical protein
MYVTFVIFFHGPPWFCVLCSEPVPIYIGAVDTALLGISDPSARHTGNMRQAPLAAGLKLISRPKGRRKKTNDRSDVDVDLSQRQKKC